MLNIWLGKILNSWFEDWDECYHGHVFGRNGNRLLEIELIVLADLSQVHIHDSLAIWMLRSWAIGSSLVDFCRVSILA